MRGDGSVRGAHFVNDDVLTPQNATPAVSALPKLSVLTLVCPLRIVARSVNPAVSEFIAGPHL